jgi:signal transduction histidine kinase/ActR/RegA family two-component response regulator
VRSQLESGEIDFLMGMYKTEQRQEFADFSIPHFISSYGLFVPKGSRIQSIADMEGRLLGVQDGDLAHDYVLHHDTGADIVVKTEWSDLIRALEQQELDGILMAIVQGMMALHDAGVTNIQPVGPPLFQERYGVAVVKGDAELLALINEGLNILKMSGEYDEIYESWFGIYDRTYLMQSQWVRLFISIAGVVTVGAFLVGVWSLSLKQQVKLKTAKAHAARIRAEQASEAKSEFLARVSHELRTPLHSIIGIGRMLEQTSLEPHQREFLSLIQNASQRLFRIISDLLDVTRLHAGKLRLQTGVFRLSEIQSLLELAFRSVADTKKIRFTVKIEDPSICIRSDRDLVFQIGANLVDNAIKNTDAGEVCVRLQYGPDTGCLELGVTDTGRGIPEDQQERVFQPFSSDSSEKPGLGLGLSIVKSLVELLGGSIWFSSVENGGTTFTVTVPVEVSEEKDSGVSVDSARRIEGVGFSGEGRKVLVVEDEAINRMYLESLLREKGWEPVGVADGGEALREISLGEYDLVLMDIRMPVMDGVEVTQRFRDREKGAGRHVPIIALTAHSHQEDKDRCLAAGMDGFLSKPFTESALMRTIVTVLPQSG